MARDSEKAKMEKKMRSIVMVGLAWWRMLSAALSLEEIQFAMVSESEMRGKENVAYPQYQRVYRNAAFQRIYAGAEEIIQEDGDFQSERSMMLVMMKKKRAMKAAKKKIECES